MDQPTAVSKSVDVEHVSSPLRAGAPWWVLPVAIFAASRLTGAALLEQGVGMEFAHLPSFFKHMPPGHPPVAALPPTFQHLLTNWDGQWYHTITEHGYPTSLPRVDGVVQQNAWAFYPLFPALVWCLMALGLEFAVAGSLLSVVCGCLACCALFRLLRRHTTTFTAALTVTALCFSPAGLIFQVTYTDSLALLLIVLALDSLSQRRYWPFISCALLMAITRPIVLPLAAVAAVHGLARWRARDVDPIPAGEARSILASVIVPALGFLLWPAVAGLSTGEATAYLATQRAWVEDGAGGWPTWVIQSATWSSPDVAVITMVVLTLTLLLGLRRESRGWGVELRVWVVVYPLFILASTRPTPSFLRYLILSVVLWWPFPGVSDRVSSGWVRASIVFCFVLVGSITQYVWMSHFWVWGPSTIGYP